jgi:hypothetical protein
MTSHLEPVPEAAIDERHYVPVLKGRAAEYDALSILSDGEKDALTPLIELMPIPWDFANDHAMINGNEHVDSATRNLARSWGPGRRVLVDLPAWLGPEARTIEGDHPMVLMLRLATETGLSVVPVLGLDRDTEYIEAVRDGHTGHGACLRLTSADLVRADIDGLLAQLLGTLGLAPGGADLIVDLKELNPEAVDFNIIGAMGVVTAVPDVEAWRSLTLLGSGFPQNLADMQPASESRFPRAEWAVCSSLRGRNLRRTPTYGDYSIDHPNPPVAIDPRLLRVSAQLRYTDETDWLVFKERNIRDFGNEQFIDICRRLVTRPEFRGADFSWGDNYIAVRAAGTDTRPGNPRTWRKVGTSHHIATVIDQLANLES